MSRYLLAAAAVAGAAGIAMPARAWSPIASSRPTWRGPAPYSLHHAGSEDLGGYDATLPIVRQGFDDWARLECSALRTDFRGSTTAVPFQSGSNVVGWIERNWIDDPNAIGITGPSWGAGGHIVDAQMAMNGVHFTWITGPGSGNRVNAYSIVLHEAGHYFGLGHSSDPDATMYYAYGGGVSSLNADDERGICTLYPGGGGGPIDGGGTPPPPGPGPGPDPGPPEPPSGGTTCARCTSDAACSGGRCLRYPDGNGYCGARCSSDADCGGDRCEAASDGSRVCVRRDASGRADCSASAPTPPPEPPSEPPPSEPPPSEPECRTHGDCGPGERCDPESGRCVLAPQGRLGDPCTSGGECVSGLCAEDLERGGAFCTELCSDAMPCPAGFSCEDAGGGQGACRPVLAGLGASCRAPSDCASGLCAETADGRRFCTRTCTDSMPCPGRFDCVPLDDGATSVCAPGAGAGPPGRGSVLRGQSCALHASGRDHRTAGGWLALVLGALVVRRASRGIRTGRGG
ncbi:MAG: matrixin family metalloprotease [Myxococcota bacterium]|nr:matrixin family metalloprotease [Myxococcota bacterium]MDW8362148.1 matrixin family metalloprotease [Myxococcales bacterium]